MKADTTKQQTAIINAIDLFCGAGGLTHGLIRGGINVIAGVDIDETCKYPYEANNASRFIRQDISSMPGDLISNLFTEGAFSLLAGCAPCQPFSSYSQSGRKSSDNADWGLVATFGRLVREIKPHFVTMENVPQVEHHDVFQEFLSALVGYHVFWKTIECASVGIPQTRRRLVLIASRLGCAGLEFPLITGTPTTVRQAIGHLPSIRAGESDQSDPLHVACRLSDLNLKRIRASRPGGTWRDWDSSIRAACHRKSTGATYPSVYGRMEWDAPAPTMTTQSFGYGNGRFGHPEQDRAISLREAAILQTFPPNYAFVSKGEKVKFSHLGRLIGNAVPVRLGEIIANSFMKHAETYVISNSV